MQITILGALRSLFLSLFLAIGEKIALTNWLEIKDVSGACTAAPTEQSETGSATPRVRSCAYRCTSVYVCPCAPVLSAGTGASAYGRKLLIFIYPRRVVRPPSCAWRRLRGKASLSPVAWHGPFALHSSGKTMAPGQWACALRCHSEIESRSTAKNAANRRENGKRRNCNFL